MNELSKQILDQYQIRKTKVQKDRFIELLKSRYPELEVQTKGLLKSRNLIIGDVEKANVILGAHYDTCARMFVPNFITPKNPLISILYSFIIAIPILIAMSIVNGLLGFLTDNFWVHYFISLGTVFGLLILMMAGPENKHTANDNTSGVITLCQMLEQMTPEQKETTAVVFFDHEELGLIGSSQFRKKYKKLLTKKLMINFDCVSDGDNLFIAPSKAARKELDSKIAEAFQDTETKKIVFVNSEKAYYPSDQAGFPRHIAVAALNHHKLLGLYMDKIHTNKDTVFDEENIETLCQCTLKLIDNM